MVLENSNVSAHGLVKMRPAQSWLIEVHVNTKAEQLLNEVLQLPEEERWGIFARLLDDLDTVPDDDQDEAAWLAELQRRNQDADAGRTKDIPGAEVFGEIRAKLRRP